MLLLTICTDYVKSFLLLILKYSEVLSGSEIYQGGSPPLPQKFVSYLSCMKICIYLVFSSKPKSLQYVTENFVSVGIPMCM